MAYHPVLFHLRHASVFYATETQGTRQALNQVDLRIGVGEWIAVTGRNGSGKSTLASVLLGICPPSRGHLERSRDLVVRGVLQHPDAQLIGDTVEEEFRFALNGRQDRAERFHKRIETALNNVGLSLPADYPVRELSGGQKQLLNVAAALAAEPDMIVLDEPTAMLDPAVRETVLQAVREAHRQGAAVIWITHRLDELSAAERVVAFNSGSIDYDGSPRVFFYGSDSPKRRQELPFVHSPCERLGLEAPYVIRVARNLQKRGMQMLALPMTADELAEAVTSCR